MKKLLIGTAAVALGLSMTAPAQADGVNLDVGGHFKGYGAFVDQDDNITSGTATGDEARDFDFLRETEVHFSGETTLDNGLTVGAHVEVDLDAAISTEEAYAYFSGAWGRVNLGEEDGAAYLLQVAAPSADSNVDGLRQYIQPVNYSALFGVPAPDASLGGGLGVIAEDTAFTIDYDQDISGQNTKITYITPVISGFQAGASYTPELGDSPNGTDGVNLDGETDGFGDVFDVAVRWEGQLNDLGIALGAGYTQASIEEDGAAAANSTSDDREAWNVGVDLDFGPFGLGVVYKEDDNGQPFTNNSTTTEVDDEEVLVVGVDYTTGPFKLGASYYTADNHLSVEELETERWTGGVVYTYGPGMTFRGSVQYIEHDNIQNAAGIDSALAAGTDDVDATSFLLGTQIKF